MSIVRVGLAETKDFSEGYDRIFGKKEVKDQEQPRQEEKKEEAKSETEQAK